MRHRVAQNGAVQDKMSSEKMAAPLQKRPSRVREKDLGSNFDFLPVLVFSRE